MASIQKSNYTMISENWSFAETFRFEEVVYLLCGYEPAVGIDHEIRRKLLPASIPGEELLMSSMRSGDLLLAALGEPLWALGPVAQFKAQPYHPGHIITRSELQKIVAAKWPGKRPKFLFPEDATDAVREMQSKGGSTPSAPVAAVKMTLQIIQDDDGIVGTLTNHKLIAWFESRSATKDKPHDIHGDFKKAHIEGRETIVWYDRDGDRHDRSLDTIRHYYKDLKGR